MRHRLAAACCLLLAAPLAAAGDRLFPTDVPRSGEFDGALGVGYNQSELDDDIVGRIESDVWFATVTTRIGLGGGLALGAAVPYIFGGATCFGSACSDNDKELGSVDVGLDWEITAGSSGPVSASFGLTYDTSSADSETESFTVDFTGATRLAHDARTYLSLKRYLPQFDGGTDAWQVELGAHLGVDTGARVVPEIFYVRGDEDQFGGSATAIGGGLSVIIDASRSSRFVPGVFYQQDDYEDFEPFKTWGVQLTFYGLGGEAPPVSRVRKPAAKPAAAAEAPVTAPAPSALPAAPAAQPIASAPAAPQVQAGPYALPKPAGLFSRPRPDVAADATLEAGTEVLLKSRVVNDGGAWWFAESGERRGWLREAELR